MVFKYDENYDVTLTLNMTKYDFEYVCEKKSWLQTCPIITLSMFVKGKVDFKCVRIWLWVCLSNEKLTLDMSKYDIKYFVKGKVDFRYVWIWLWVYLWKEKLTLDMTKYYYK
jgi:hypothetical protein